MAIMIREKSLKLLWLEALMRHLLQEDSEFHYYHERFHRVEAGYAGERNVDSEWLELVYPHTFLYCPIYFL
ncbi:hypothetical protein MHB42_03005 [Lysinibacillus sp. FSL K6-0232]|uniref:hypothetical protein n=1 Tax=Lysinibacillus sp. FSL K6-0232 TaxID=2921425 RepID=UPI0030F6C5E8